jgi:hypothetical protein
MLFTNPNLKRRHGALPDGAPFVVDVPAHFAVCRHHDAVLFPQWERQAQVSGNRRRKIPDGLITYRQLEACGAPARIRRSVSPVRALRWRLVPIQIATTATTTSESTTRIIADLNVIAGDL